MKPPDLQILFGICAKTKARSVYLKVCCYFSNYLEYFTPYCEKGYLKILSFNSLGLIGCAGLVSGWVKRVGAAYKVEFIVTGEQNHDSLHKN